MKAMKELRGNKQENNDNMTIASNKGTKEAGTQTEETEEVGTQTEETDAIGNQRARDYFNKDNVIT